jgi:anti-sigma factor RsiW
MTCRHCVDFLLDYIDGLLPGDQRAAFDAHLSICPDCTTYLDNYRKAAALTAGLGREDRRAGDQVPAGLVEAILKARKLGR